MSQRHLRAAVILVGIMQAMTVLRGEDWPDYRGKGNRGVWEETGILDTFPADGLASRVRWRTCASRIRCQAATGSWTRFLQWETQRTWLGSAGDIVCRPANVSGVWPFNEA